MQAKIEYPFAAIRGALDLKGQYYARLLNGKANWNAFTFRDHVATTSGPQTPLPNPTYRCPKPCFSWNGSASFCEICGRYLIN